MWQPWGRGKASKSGAPGGKVSVGGHHPARAHQILRAPRGTPGSLRRQLHTGVFASSGRANSDSQSWGSHMRRPGRRLPGPAPHVSSPALLEVAVSYVPIQQQLLSTLYKLKAISLGRAEPALGPAVTAQLAGLCEAAAPLIPKLLLLLTAMLWASNPVALRLLYDSPGAPDPVLVTATRGTLQAVLLLFFSRLGLDQRGENEPVEGVGHCGEAPPGGLLQQWLGQQSAPLWMAALELGLLCYVAASSQTFGLQLTGATRASFLIQAKSFFTPLLAALAGFAPSSRVRLGCGLALGGALLIATDNTDGAGAGGLDFTGLFTGGDAAILVSALFYSLNTVRITGYARSLPAVDIAAGKSLVLAGAAVTSLLVTAAGVAQQGQPLSSLWEGWADPTAWAAMVWLAVGPGALASYLSVKGLKDVPPAEAQVIFSSMPLWAAGLTWLFLGGEELGPLAWAGGAAIMAAGIVASISPSQQHHQQQQRQERTQHEPLLQVLRPSEQQPQQRLVERRV